MRVPVTGGARNNTRGQVAGVYTLADGIRHGFLFDAGNFTTIDVPGAVGTQGFAINNPGDIVGHFLTPDGKSHGFLLNQKGDFLSIDVPGAVSTGGLAGVIGTRHSMFQAQPIPVSSGLTLRTILSGSIETAMASDTGSCWGAGCEGHTRHAVEIRVK